MKRLLPFVVTMLALLFPALASAQSEQGKIATMRGASDVYLITMETEGEGTITAKDGGGNTVNSGDKVKKAAYLTFTATPAEGYEVDNWYVNGALDFTNSGQTTKEIEIYEDTSVKVVFKQVQMYTVTYSAGENGTLAASIKSDDSDDVPVAII